MKKRLLGFLVLFLVTGASVMAQQSVTGRVTSSVDGAPLPGVSVLVKGTTTGTSTDVDGRYTISVSDNSAVLVFSFIGFTTQEVTVGNQTSVEVQMSEDTQELGEVVVTAFGLEREKKSLTYTVQDVKTEELSKARELNIVNSLSGKVAGLSVTRSGTGVGGGSRVLLRGNRSIFGDSQPLYIVDGVPAAGISNLNPDDVESINVLKGPNAAALYGNRANNGAIIVTTKKGSSTGLNISVNTSYMVDQPLLMTDYQNVYGQGNNGVYSAASEYSWGPMMNGEDVAHWSPDPNRPADTYGFSAQPDNVKDFFQNGHNLATTLAVSGGNEKAQTYFSYTFTDAAGVVPNNELGRHSLNLRITNKLTEKLTLDSKVNYIRQDIDNQLFEGENFANPIRHAYRLPRNIRTQDISQFEYTNAVGLVRQNYFNPGSNGGANPYWTINRNLRTNSSDRVVAFASLNYELAKGLTVLARAAVDRSVGGSTEKLYADSYVIADFGRFTVGSSESREINTDFLISYEKNLNDNWYFNFNVGGNARKNRNSSLSSNTGTGLTVRNFFALGNTQQVVSTHGVSPTAVAGPSDVNSLYSFAQLAWKNAVFLDVTARNDWSSTLPKENWSFFYPSVGLNVVVSDLTTLPEFFTFAKVRASFAEVGNDTRPFMLERTATFTGAGVGGWLALSTVLPNEDLLPEETRSIELGTDLRFLDNRIGLDLTYYKTNSLNQLFQVALPVGSGASSFFTNGGDVQNEGFEVMLTVTPMRTSNFDWEITTNFSRNISMVNEINDERPSLDIGGDFLRRYIIEEGKPFGEVYSRGFVRDDQGRVLVRANGLPMVTSGTTVRVANNNPKWLAGIQNSFRYKNFTANFTVDFRVGGTVTSLTNAIMYADGLTEETLPGRDGGLIFGENLFSGETGIIDNIVAGVPQANHGLPNDIPITSELFWINMGGRNAPVGEAFVVEATNVRMREVVLGYTLPSSVLANLPFKSVSLNFVGRNLFFFTNKANNIDPDVVVGTGAIGEGFDSFGPPTARSYGFNVNLGF
ncbi:MAG: SusC/RagA family TonB-linked outer membrane protein [Chryseosolibacter sp.]